MLVEAHCGLFIHMKVEAHCGASLLGFVSDHRVVMILQVPREALEFAGCRLTSVPANSGTPYVLFSAKVMLKFSVIFSMTLLK